MLTENRLQNSENVRCSVRPYLQLFVKVSCLICIICVYLRVVSNTYCVVFCLSTSMLPVSRDCPFFNADIIHFYFLYSHYSHSLRSRHGRDRMVVGFIITYAISAYDH
jgi:hypothetical protein